MNMINILEQFQIEYPKNNCVILLDEYIIVKKKSNIIRYVPLKYRYPCS